MRLGLIILKAEALIFENQLKLAATARFTLHAKRFPRSSSFRKKTRLSELCLQIVRCFVQIASTIVSLTIQTE